MRNIKYFGIHYRKAIICTTGLHKHIDMHVFHYLAPLQEAQIAQYLSQTHVTGAIAALVYGRISPDTFAAATSPTTLQKMYRIAAQQMSSIPYQVTPNVLQHRVKCLLLAFYVAVHGGCYHFLFYSTVSQIVIHVFYLLIPNQNYGNYM